MFIQFPFKPSIFRSGICPAFRSSTETLLTAIIGQLALKFSFSNVIEAVLIHWTADYADCCAWQMEVTQ
jgi:hypothetical protein